MHFFAVGIYQKLRQLENADKKYIAPVLDYSETVPVGYSENIRE
jgi:hypothetical protein